MISRNGVPFCLDCDADRVRGQHQDVGVIINATPCEPEKDYHAEPPTSPSVPQPPEMPLPTAGMPTIIALLRALPMPADIKAFKNIQKAIALLQKVGATSTGEK
jgi:hypothetical protein